MHGRKKRITPPSAEEVAALQQKMKTYSQLMAHILSVQRPRFVSNASGLYESADNEAFIVIGILTIYCTCCPRFSFSILSFVQEKFFGQILMSLLCGTSDAKYLIRSVLNLRQ